MAGICVLFVFQFHEGPIKTALEKLAKELQKKFQFHEGPIKTGSTLSYPKRSYSFQFHEGPIKTSGARAAARLLSCFNSMKVRLKHYNRQPADATLLFQFHEGPIKTAGGGGPKKVVACFNSMKVRLKPIAFFSKIPLYTRGIIIQRYKNSSRKYVDVE